MTKPHYWAKNNMNSLFFSLYKNNISVVKMFNKAHSILNPNYQNGNNIKITLDLNFVQYAA